MTIEAELKSRLLHAANRLSHSIQNASSTEAAYRADLLRTVSELLSRLETGVRDLSPTVRQDMVDVLSELEPPTNLDAPDLARIRNRLVHLAKSA